MTATAAATEKKPRKAAAVPAQATSKGEVQPKTEGGLVVRGQLPGPRLGPFRAGRTKKATWSIYTPTAGELLIFLGVWDGKEDFDIDKIAKSDIQRQLLTDKAGSNKDQMSYDILRGGMLPALVADHRGGDAVELLDGWQRIDVILKTAARLWQMKKDADSVDTKDAVYRNIPSKEGDEEYPAMEFDQWINEFRVPLQVVEEVEEEEKVYLFDRLNAGEKVSASHLAENALRRYADFFKGLGFSLVTSAEKATGGAKILKGEVRKWVQADLFLALYGCANEADYDPRTVMLKGDKTPELIGKFLEKYGTAVGEDFKWVLMEYIPALQEAYADPAHAKQLVVKQIKDWKDTFYIPLVTAITFARTNGTSEEDITARKAMLMEALKAGKADPLELFSGRESYNSYVDNVPGSQGQRTRRLTQTGYRIVFGTGTKLSWKKAWTQAK